MKYENMEDSNTIDNYLMGNGGRKKLTSGQSYTGSIIGWRSLEEDSEITVTPNLDPVPVDSDSSSQTYQLPRVMDYPTLFKGKDPSCGAGSIEIFLP